MTQAIDNLLAAAKCALADLKGIMPEFEPSGDRTHPGWQTIKELKTSIAGMRKASKGKPIVIEVRGGVVQDVLNVPTGIRYEIKYHDDIEAEE